MASVKRSYPWILVVLLMGNAMAADQPYSFCKGAPKYVQPPRGVPPEPVKLQNDQFIRQKDGAIVRLKAFNWFGFNNGQTALDGLWAGGNAAQTDLATITYQLRLLGFNGVRLPFLFKDLSLPPQSKIMPCQPVNEAYMMRRTLDPAYKAAERSFPKRTVPALPLGKDGRTCNGYLPNSSTLDRYTWAVQWFVANGFYVLTDYHPMGMEWVQNDINKFVSSWKWVWGAIACLPNFSSDLKGRVFVDIMNEPDSVGVRWEPTASNGSPGTPNPGITQLYLRTMDALWDMTPDAVIFFVEGGGQGNLQGVNWGNGFATDRSLVRSLGLSDPNPWFEAILERAYRKSVVISPHVYGPSVSHLKTGFAGAGFWKMLDLSFGYLTKRGYCRSGDCQRFPVAIGEFGSRFKDAGDLRHLNDFAAYLNNEGKANTGQHNAIGNWFYWSYNANSGDTGGLVDDTWRTLLWVKLRYLISKLGLRPWWHA